jgi:hypothetical protein
MDGADDRPRVVYAEHPGCIEVVAWEAGGNAEDGEQAVGPCRERNRPVRVGNSAGDYTVVIQGLAPDVRELDERE